MRREYRPVAFAALAASLPSWLLPVSNPDLFWHLSAARRIWRSAQVPSADWLSWTMAGRPWVDFEWLSQLAFGAAHAAGGLAGLWLLKVALVCAAAWRLHAWMGLYRIAPELKAAGISVWATAMLPRSDARPELFSILLFLELFRRLERWRLEGRAPSPALLAAAFALWANLHAGFAYGLALVAWYACGGLPWRAVAGAAAGTLLQPAGWSVYRVLLSHGADAGELSRWIIEWGPPALPNPWRWAELALVPAAALAWALAVRQGRRPPWLPAAALGALAVAGLRHARLAAYFVTAAAPLGLAWVQSSTPARARALALGLIAASGAWSLRCAWETGVFRRHFNDRLVPARAAAFLAREASVLGERALYNPWGWGGYLGWTLPEPYRVFQDGRYLFHPLLLEAGRATATAAAWQEFLLGKGVDLALMENLPLLLPGTRVYPDGRERSIPRPYYAFYMPRERWALVHFDEKALLFVRRDAVPAAWLAAREFRYVRPYDEEALQDALRRGEVPAAELRRERERLAAAGPLPR
ncbi:MAG: hypothetical protein HY554_16335 [Elusimicrobia bacterium]|nr:hypothetical protein [Elusimicrobiota bacterium]